MKQNNQPVVNELERRIERLEKMVFFLGGVLMGIPFSLIIWRIFFN